MQNFVLSIIWVNAFPLFTFFFKYFEPATASLSPFHTGDVWTKFWRCNLFENTILHYIFAFVKAIHF